MLDIKKIESISELGELKQAYFAAATAPLDGMWHFGFVPMSDHFGFYEDNQLVGYCVVNGENYLLQFYLSPLAKAEACDLYTLIAQGNSSVIGTLNGAFVSTAETEYMAMTLDNSVSFNVNAMMYRFEPASKDQEHNRNDALPMQLAVPEKLDDFVDFAASAIGAPKEWLSGYFANLIQRDELWGYWVEGQLVATGECRFFDDIQKEFADLGMIVAQSERGKGIATGVLEHLVEHALNKQLTPICSTEVSNIGAQRAISRVGMRSKNRIVQFEFEPS
ncbi:GNAT family N-acetyltransferase [Vibrio sp. 99-70-13A1]|uniref:GNAT family N-acetyltransferase n=1 Tax=Vibrio sp. 99-70-13A1 TaxID=2607601 RepID=UPI0014936600|nr:GNAT family N-acetyltransferase [Vibrio sp. 99-70-13A1]NOH95855.1 GNAT family N-acetyltransferase [Vibrio sp. 99-70-13A1]